MRLLRKIYDWILDKSNHPKAPWFLALISFSESSFFPIPPDVILIPMVIANKTKAFWYAFVCTISSVLGGIVGYCIGSFFYTTVGIIIINYYALQDQFITFENLYKQYGILIVLIASFTPFPFKFITIASGLFHLNIFLFVLCSLLGRGFRFYLIAILLKIFGDIVKEFIDRYFNILTLLFFVVLIGSFVLLKYL